MSTQAALSPSFRNTNAIDAALDGTLTVESHPGIGTTPTVELPLTAAVSS